MLRQGIRRRHCRVPLPVSRIRAVVHPADGGSSFLETSVTAPSYLTAQDSLSSQHRPRNVFPTKTTCISCCRTSAVAAAPAGYTVTLSRPGRLQQAPVSTHPAIAS